LRYFFRAAHGLQVQDLGFQHQKPGFEVVHVAGKIGAPKSGEELIQSRNVPPSVNIGLAYADASFA